MRLLNCTPDRGAERVDCVHPMDLDLGISKQKDPNESKIVHQKNNPKYYINDQVKNVKKPPDLEFPKVAEAIPLWLPS